MVQIIKVLAPVQYLDSSDDLSMIPSVRDLQVGHCPIPVPCKCPFLFKRLDYELDQQQQRYVKQEKCHILLVDYYG